ncbi:ferredoxin [Reichenbachiella sp. 5M10]|uniref:DUF4198 domain-containing protein n=1 Tax=Reichenbachiella sp. 5M10 TaxID=1889772 RepID=UPI000C158F2D|nr:DUF4198 domain-containing protein [Reichenbachiella sp. 5M10]PIB34779.1 ferredoxin [Reichenbachiella sp. 5M10]
MKHTILFLTLLLSSVAPSFAHFMWVETNPTGHIDQSQEVRVFFGEYTYGVFEKVGEESFNKMADFDLWVVSPSGKKSTLKTTAKENAYVAQFTPTENGTYTVILDNNNIEVIDYTKYDFGIFKTHYHSVVPVQVGTNITDSVLQNEKGLAIKKIATNDDTVLLQVFFQNKPLAKNELTVFVADQWSKTLYTDEDGKVSFELPWDTKYIVETTTKEEVPGKYKGDAYEFVWHCATMPLLLH